MIHFTIFAYFWIYKLFLIIFYYKLFYAEHVLFRNLQHHISDHFPKINSYFCYIILTFAAYVKVIILEAIKAPNLAGSQN